MPARRAIYQDKAAGPGLGKFDALLASREAHEELLLGQLEREKMASSVVASTPSPLASVLAQVRRHLGRRRGGARRRR